MVYGIESNVLLEYSGAGIHIDKLIQNAILKSEPLTLCFFFDRKKVNDAQGHKVGDEYILRTVDMIQRKTCRGAIVCRVGGDEFIAVLSNFPKKMGNALYSQISLDF